MNRVLSLILVCLLNLICIPVMSWADNSGAAFLKITPGARPAGMGGAGQAVSGNVGCLYYNPSGIAAINRNTIGATHAEWITDMKYEFVAGAFRMREGVVGFSATLLSVGEMEARSADRSAAGNFSAYDLALQVSYAERFYGKNLIGGSVKMIRQVIADEQATGIAVDAGIQRELLDNFNIGLSLRNLGPKMKFISEGFNFPLSAGAGAGYRFGGALLAADISYGLYDKDFKMSLGTEYAPAGFLSVRGGYLMSMVKDTVSGISSNGSDRTGLSGGFGVNILNYSFDYAVVPYAELGTAHRISLTAEF